MKENCKKHQSFRDVLEYNDRLNKTVFELSAPLADLLARAMFGSIVDGPALECPLYRELVQCQLDLLRCAKLAYVIEEKPCRVVFDESEEAYVLAAPGSGSKSKRGTLQIWEASPHLLPFIQQVVEEEFLSLRKATEPSA